MTALNLAEDKKKQDNVEEEQEDEDDDEEVGSGIEFLPANKKVLKQKLIYLLGEYREGNTRLHNQIVVIATQLDRLHSLPKFLREQVHTTLNWVYD